MRPLRILHVISSLGPAGAERMLYNIIEATRSDAIEHAVVSLTGGGVVGEMLRARGISVASLGMRSGVPDPLAAVRLVSRIRAAAPDVVQSWMYHADLLAGLGAAAAGRVPVVWGIRNGDPRGMKWLTHVTRAACARLSGIVPARIVCCAEAVMRSHVAAGYRADRMVVIPNGFDLGRLAPDPAAGARVRAELDVPSGAAAVGLVARFHPDKDHRTFFLAAKLVADAMPGVMFLLAGFGVTSANAVLGKWIDELGLGGRVRLLGVRSDVPAVLAGLDVLVQSSRVEGFPNVLGEAMACGVPVAATSCGESEEIVGDTGRIVPIGDPGALASAVVELLALPAERRAALGRAARRRVMERYDIHAVALRFQALWGEVAEAHGFKTAGAGS
jgi:glycosyltransferase involved in cell wall biosynthesis